MGPTCLSACPALVAARVAELHGFHSSTCSTIPRVQNLLKIPESNCLFWVTRSGLSSTGSQFLVTAGSLGNLTFNGHYCR